MGEQKALPKDNEDFLSQEWMQCFEINILQPSLNHVITVFRPTWMTIKINGVVTDLFCTGVIGHPRHIFKLGIEIPN